MRAICANPASPLGENDFFRNQTGKLGLRVRLDAREQAPEPFAVLKAAHFLVRRTESAVLV